MDEEKILLKIDRAKTLSDLIDVWNYLANNKFDYSLDEISILRNKIKKKALNCEGDDLRKSKFYHFLNK